MAKFINPFTDFGFKKLFGEEASKPFLMDFLNSMLPAHHQIAQLTLKNNEQLGITEFDRKSIYDIYCESITGEKFIVELQRAKQDHFKDRTVYYSTFPIAEQAKKGNWAYQLKAVYCINILNFVLNDHQDDNEVIYTVQLKDQNNDVFYDKLTFIYLQMPNFNKSENDLKSNLDKWLFFIKNLDDLQSIPQIFKDSIIEQAFETANIATFDKSERSVYEQSLKIYRDWYSLEQTAIRKGREEGLAEGKAVGLIEGKLETQKEIVHNLLNLNMSVELICQATGLTAEEIKQLNSLE